MKLVGVSRLTEFIRKHPDARQWLENWIVETRHAEWKNTQDIKNRFNSASFLHKNTVIFNVKGNSYRMEIQIAYKTGTAVVKRIGTHAEYERW